MLKLSWLISLGITLFGFLVIQHFFTIKPEEVTANGNLGLVGIVIVFPFLLLSLFTTYRFFFVKIINANDQLMKVISIFGGLIMVALLVYLVVDYKSTILSSSESNLTFYEFPQLNEYTYEIYFNFYTYALLHTISGTFGVIVGFIQSKKVKEELAK